jgi:hypothetical protein
MTGTLCDPYIWEDIQVIPNAFSPFLNHRKEGPCASEIFNCVLATLTLATLSSIIFYQVMDSLYPAAFFFITAAFLLAPLFLRSYNVPTAKKEEGFQPQRSEPEAITYPTARNPFMNVLIDEIKYNPMRGPAANIGEKSTKVTLDDFFRIEFNSDPTDVFGRTQSQRQFITMPSTTVPNDQASFQNWLYKIPGKTCKEGGREACLPGTDGGKLPWLSVER